MEGRTQESRSMVNPSYIGDGNMGPYGGGTYTGGGNDPTVEDWENIFGPAARDIKIDNQRHKRHQRWHLPDALKGSNNFIADRVDGLITDATNSPFTTAILPYLYIDQPDKKLKWSSYSFDEGLASRVPYESAARVLTQTKRSFAAYLVRHGLAIAMEHNFMMSPAGRQNFNDQLKQLVGSIQYSNDLDVHIALITAPSYAKTWAEKYHSVDKTSAQICREYIDVFGFVQKNANALDILIEEAKSVLKLWGSPPPSFLLCNSKLTFQLQMNPDRTNYVTQGIDGVRRLREGPNIGSFRGLSIINSRSFSMETGAPPRDIMRRRVRVAEYYRIPPQGVNTKWEVQLYDESRDTWFTMKKEELQRLACLDTMGLNPRQLPPDEELVWDEYKVNGRYPTVNNTVHLVYPDTVNPVAKLIKPADFDLDIGLPVDWAATRDAVNAIGGGIYAGANLKRHHYKTIVDQLVAVTYLRPNARHVALDFPAAANTTRMAAWVFGHTALFENVLQLLFTVVPVSEALMRQEVFPFLYAVQDGRDQAIASWTQIGPNPLNIYQSVLTIALVATLHPNPQVRVQLAQALRDARVNLSSLKAMIARFVRSSLTPRQGEEATSKIQLGRILDNYTSQTFRSAIVDGGVGRPNEAACLYDIWPSERADGVSIAHYANVSETHDSLSHQQVEIAYEQHRQFRWVDLPVQPPLTSLTDLNESDVLVVFLLSCMQRLFKAPAAQNPLELVTSLTPYLEVMADDTEDYEYVIIRPNIEHNMLGIILGRGGGPEELGATLWGQTELSCYDDSFYGVWGMSYKYHERAMVFNERNMIRLWDICYDGYNGGKDDRVVDWSREAPGQDRPFNNATTDMSVPYTGPSLMVLRFKVDTRSREYKPYWPSPIVFHDKHLNMDEPPKLSPDPESIYVLQDANMRVFNQDLYREQYRAYLHRMPDFSYFHQIRKPPGQAAVDMETSQNALAFQGSYKIRYDNHRVEETNGSGHHGPDFVGVATLRAGKGVRMDPKAPSAMRLV